MSSPKKFFLNVERSLNNKGWVDRLEDSRTALAISQRFAVPEIMGRIIAAREIGLDEVENWLEPTLRNFMPAPESIVDLPKGAERLAKAVMSREQVAIIGDYDVDGISSTSILSQFLRHAGTEPLLHIPDRMTEGYGPSIAAVEKLMAEGAQLLVTLDSGIMSHDPLARAAELGLETIIVDHHQVPETLPENFAAINPNRNDDLSGQGHLCAAGLTMMLIATLNKVLREQGWWGDDRPAPDLLQFLDLVALATVCDVVPLTGLNRAYVRQGLKIMSKRNRPGLKALADVARLANAPDTYALGFVLGPRINAAGRIGSPMDAVEMLTTTDPGRANQLAQRLESWNKERQAIELSVIDRAAIEAEAAMGKNQNLPALVVAGENWHPGVLGLAAARLKERFGVPSFVLGTDKKSGTASGSGRSISGVDLGRAVQAAIAENILIKGGGHAMAAGLTLAVDRIGDLRAFFEETLAEETALARQNQRLKIDAALTAQGANIALIEQIEKAGPFGTANPAPVFAFPAHKIVYADIVGTDHVRCTLISGDGARLKAIAFRQADTEMGELLLSERSMPLHFAGRLSINEWGGRREPQLLIIDVARVE